MRIKVRYSADFEKTIEVEDPGFELEPGQEEEEFSDEIADIEPGDGEYRVGTF